MLSVSSFISTERYKEAILNQSLSSWCSWLVSLCAHTHTHKHTQQQNYCHPATFGRRRMWWGGFVGHRRCWWRGQPLFCFFNSYVKPYHRHNTRNRNPRSSTFLLLSPFFEVLICHHIQCKVLICHRIQWHNFIIHCSMCAQIFW